MEVRIHPSHFVQAWAYLTLSSHSLCGTCSITGLNPPRGTPTENFGRRRGSHTATEGREHTKAPLIGLAQQLLARLATFAHAIWLATPALFLHIGAYSPFISWPLPCNHLTELPPSSLHTTRGAPSPPFPEELPAHGSNEKPGATPTPKVPHRLLSGGTPARTKDSHMPGHNP